MTHGLYNHEESSRMRLTTTSTFDLQAVCVYEQEVAFGVSVLVAQNRDHDLPRRQAMRGVRCCHVQRPQQLALDHLQSKHLVTTGGRFLL